MNILHQWMKREQLLKIGLKSLCAYLLLIGMGACDSPYLSLQYQDFGEEQQWFRDSVAVFDFQIDNPAARYDLSYHVRNTRDYPYYNLYVQCVLMNEAGVVIRQKQHEVYLMHPKTGKPLGNGKSLYEHEVPLWEGYQFEKAGKYQFRINQYMRLDTLQGVSAVGFGVLAVEQE